MSNLVPRVIASTLAARSPGSGDGRYRPINRRPRQSCSKPVASRCCLAAIDRRDRQIDGQTDRRTDTVPLQKRLPSAAISDKSRKIGIIKSCDSLVDNKTARQNSVTEKQCATKKKTRSDEPMIVITTKVVQLIRRQLSTWNDDDRGAPNGTPVRL